MKSVIDILDLSVDELYQMMDVAIDIDEHPERYAHRCDGKKLATLFFEPSTRTRLSHEAAMLELGGSVIGFSGAQNSSAAKGESVADTAKTVSCYADIIAMRHPVEGASLVAANNASIPLINAGDGGHCHPTQTLADLLTIYREKGTLSGLTIGMCGDLLYGRTVHSLINAMTRYEGNKFVLISPDELALPDYALDALEKSGASYKVTTSLEDSIPELDILYMTRIQRERFDDPDQYERLKDSYSLTVEKMELAKPDMAVLHPLPRVNEISVKVDDDPRACYFRQCLNGKLMRMALILKLLDEAKDKEHKGYWEKGEVRTGGLCTNHKCITKTEQELDVRYYIADDGSRRCYYCDAVVE
ncbi:MAG: aspartate carbamoyltransferase [Clostridiales bacterium]|jgi:aspartate carbamoyltransferase catalytic subunit|nr:aspartate carbamoyltransferase [Clostridiales bacterium]